MENNGPVIEYCLSNIGIMLDNKVDKETETLAAPMILHTQVM